MSIPHVPDVLGPAFGPTQGPGELDAREQEAHAVVAWASGQLVRIGSAEDAADIVLRVVEHLGGTWVPARCAAEDAVPLDVSLGTSEPILPVAPPNSVQRMLLERHLPRLVASARDAVELIGTLDQLRHDATIDSLTRLGNRRAIHRVLSRARPGTTLVAFDLDGFKGVNDRHGHAAGDQVLCAFAEVLRRHVREVDHLGRLGGDEFLAVLPDATAEDALRVLERLRSAWDGTPGRHDVSFSAGVATVGDADPDDALLRADNALYEAKAAGKGRWVVAETQAP